MALREVKLPRVQEQRVLFAVQGIKPEDDFRVLSTSDEARRIGGLVVGVISGDLGSRDDLKADFESRAPVRKRGGAEKVSSYGELRGVVEGMTRRADRARDEGDEDGAERIEKVLNSPRFKLLRDDIEDGAVMAVQFEINRGGSPDLVGALKEGDWEVADTLLGGESGGGVLAGVAERVADKLIYSTEARQLMVEMARMMDRTSRIGGNKEERDALGDKIRGLYDGVHDDDAVLLENYYAWAVIEAGDAVGGGGADGVDRIANALARVVGGGGIMPAGVGGATEVSGQASTFEALRRVRLDSLDLAEVSRWALDVSELLTANPLFWAGGWQQATGHLATEVKSMAMKTGADWRKEQGAMRTVEAILTLRTQEAAILACDETLSRYVELSPPVDSMTSYVWNGALRSELEKDPVTRIALDWIVQSAYDVSDDGASIQSVLMALGKEKNGGKTGLHSSIDRTVEALMDQDDEVWPQVVSEYRKGGFSPEKIDRNFVERRVRLAWSLFIVDEYPGWAVWLHQQAKEKSSDRSPLLSWYNAEPVLSRRKLAEATNYNPVPGRSSNRFGKYETFVGHPFYAIMDPAGLLRVKGGGYGEEVIREFEHGMLMLADWRFMTDEGGGRRPLRPSEMDGKKMMRWAKTWNAIAGDPFGSGFDNWKDIEVAAQQMQNLDSTSEDWKYSRCGEIFSHLLIAKLRAIRAADPRSGLEVFINNIALTAEQGLAEQQKMLQELLGSDKSGTLGILRDLRAQYGLMFGTKSFMRAFDRFITGAKTEDEASKLLKVNVLSQMFVALAGMVDGGKKKR